MSQDKRDIAIEKAKKIIEEHPDKNDYVCKYIVRSYDHNNNPTDNSIELDEFWEDCKRIIAPPLPSKEQGTGAEGEAKRLIELFWHKISGVPDHCGVDINSEDSYVKLAKQCAIICVDEILKTYGLGSVKYYQQVRTCIDKM